MYNGKKCMLFVTVTPMPFAIYRTHQQLLTVVLLKEPMGVNAPSCIDCH